MIMIIIIIIISFLGGGGFMYNKISILYIELVNFKIFQ